jgi:hypothetical protein
MANFLAMSHYSSFLSIGASRSTFSLIRGVSNLKLMKDEANALLQASPSARRDTTPKRKKEKHEKEKEKEKEKPEKEKEKKLSVLQSIQISRQSVRGGPS